MTTFTEKEFFNKTKELYDTINKRDWRIKELEKRNNRLQAFIERLGSVGEKSKLYDDMNAWWMSLNLNDKVMLYKYYNQRRSK